MKQNTRWRLTLIAVLFFGLIGWSVYGQKRGPVASQAIWEYKIVYDGNGDRRAEERLKPLGAEGWELVNAEKVNDTSEIIFFLKRAK